MGAKCNLTENKHYVTKRVRNEKLIIESTRRVYTRPNDFYSVGPLFSKWLKLDHGANNSVKLTLTH